MTQREFFTMVINSTMSNDVKEYAREAIAKLDKRNATKSHALTKTQKENEPIKNEILALLDEATEPQLASEIAKALDITTNKASGILTVLTKNGIVTAQDVKIKGKGTRKGYMLTEIIEDEVTTEDDEVTENEGDE